MSRIVRFLKRMAKENIAVETKRTPAVSILFYDDGNTEIMARQGFLMTLEQHSALRELLTEQLVLSMTLFEQTRQKIRDMDKVVQFPVSREIN